MMFSITTCIKVTVLKLLENTLSWLTAVENNYYLNVLEVSILLSLSLTFPFNLKPLRTNCHTNCQQTLDWYS